MEVKVEITGVLLIMLGLDHVGLDFLCFWNISNVVTNVVTFLLPTGQKNFRTNVHSVCLRFSLRSTLSLNSWMTIWQQNSGQITICQIWKRWSKGWMVIQQLFCLWITIWPFDWLYPNLMNGNFTARKRSLWQGNVFTPVCQSFCSQGGSRGSLYDVTSCLDAWSHVPTGRVSVWGSL